MIYGKIKSSIFILKRIILNPFISFEVCPDHEYKKTLRQIMLPVKKKLKWEVKKRT